jgi:hypothetical protein
VRYGMMFKPHVSPCCEQAAVQVPDKFKLVLMAGGSVAQRIVSDT